MILHPDPLVPELGPTHGRWEPHVTGRIHCAAEAAGLNGHSAGCFGNGQPVGHVRGTLL